VDVDQLGVGYNNIIVIIAQCHGFIAENHSLGGFPP
jgi:O6-methylguanine-DNA--protein-cysteine methyltransferase